MSVLIFIRHGQSYNNVEKVLSHDIDKYPLTSEGREQVKRVAEELKKIRKIRINYLYTSPILRAYQTATIIGNELGLTPIIDERLRERRLGSLNNQKIDINEHWKIKLYKREIDIKDIESWEEIRRRISDFVEAVVKGDKKVIIAVSHYDPIRAFVANILNLDDIEAWGLCIPNASMTIAICNTTCKLLSIGSPLITNSILSTLNNYIFG
ncbi:MAG: 2,3-diphosphoglycerate-dependent phosphoglycerate mutase [Sulfolobaceae archaeon]